MKKVTHLHRTTTAAQAKLSVRQMSRCVRNTKCSLSASSSFWATFPKSSSLIKFCVLMSPRADKSEVQSTDATVPQQSRNLLQANLIDSADSVVDHFGIQIATESPPLALQSTSNIAQEGESQDKEADLQLARRSKPGDFNHVLGYKMPFDVISAGYAALVAAGGTIGYLKAGSVGSLVAGLAFGSVLGVGAYMTSVNPNNYYLTLGTATALGGMMGYRFANSGKFMPAGLITVLSIGMVIRFGARAVAQANQHYKK